MTDPSLRQGFVCDPAGCIGRFADGALVALVRTPEAFEEDCRRAAMVVTARTAPPGCAASVIDRKTLRAYGAVALQRMGGQWEVKVARPAGSERPWTRMAAPAESAALSSLPASPAVRDATPRGEELEPGD